jgi:hypothetical protein
VSRTGGGDMVAVVDARLEVLDRAEDAPFPDR